MPRTLERQCQFCHKSFQAPVKELNRGNAKFCSMVCRSSARKITFRAPNLNCAYCKVPFYRRNRKVHSKSGLVFCCRAHKDIAARIDGIKAIHPSSYGVTKDYRDIAFRNLPNVCNRCGFDKVLVVHHKDRDRSNNTLGNLEILCPNCHALEHLHG